MKLVRPTCDRVSELVHHVLHVVHTQFRIVQQRHEPFFRLLQTLMLPENLESKQKEPRK